MVIYFQKEIFKNIRLAIAGYAIYMYTHVDSKQSKKAYKPRGWLPI